MICVLQFLLSASYKSISQRSLYMSNASFCSNANLVHRKLVALLADQGVTYDSFDILEDDDIRQGLKTHVDWPTFPMVFFKGELLGGLDIITEMVENGEFTQVVAEAKSPVA
ncbi:thioredoxin-like protein [Gamsiella multidivaricata]|uniref:thioredoxin-like protein n=1 Tax=Gamsiella multidivaricata TaxID=101098 RepID=UPI00221E6E0A|nr:thioredoxin-like protein [Gamsiella multidivaricata]KAI7824639.1 thioredoxin-like protein [Gamsiella multidivaricata]